MQARGWNSQRRLALVRFPSGAGLALLLLLWSLFGCMALAAPARQPRPALTRPASGRPAAPAPKPATGPTPARGVARLPEFVPQTGHSETINGLAWSPDGRTLASIGGDGLMLLWDPGTGEIRRALPSRGAGVTCAAWSPDGKTLATGYEDGIVRVWNPLTGERLRESTALALGVADIAWSPDGKTLAYGGFGKVIRLWNPETGALVRDLMTSANGHLHLTWSPDGTALASAGYTRSIRVWDLNAGKVGRELPVDAFWVTALEWSPDGKTLVFGDFTGGLRLWEPATGAQRELEPKQGQVSTAAWSPDGKRLATAGADRTVHLWDAGAGKHVRRLEAPSGRVNRLAWSPDGATLACGGASGTLRLWDVAAGSVRRDLAGYGFSVNATAWHPDGKSLTSGGWEGATRVWDATTGQAGLSPSGSLSATFAVAWSPDGKTLALGGAGYVRDEKRGVIVRTVSLWDRETGQTLRELEFGGLWVTSVGWRPDGKTLATSNYEGQIRLWDPQTGVPRRDLLGHQGKINSVAWSPDGRWLAAGGDDKTVRLWDPETGMVVRELADGAAAGDPAGPGKKAGGGGLIQSLAWSPDGLTLAVGDLSGRIRLWDPATGEVRRDLMHSRPWVASLAWSPDGATLASGGRDGMIRLWNAATGELRRELQGHSATISSLAWSPDGARLASSSWDGAVRMWPMTGEATDKSVALLALRAQEGNDWLALTPEGYYDGSAGGAQRVTWRLGRELFPAARYESRFRRPGLVRRALAGEKLSQAPLHPSDIPPGAQVLSPSSDSVTEEAFVEVELFGADDRGVADAELFVNGRPLPRQSGGAGGATSLGPVTYGPPLTDGSRPILIGAKPLQVGAKPIVLGAKPLQAGAKPITLGAKPIALGAKPLVMGAKSVSERHQVSRIFKLRVPLPPGEAVIQLRAIVYDDQGYNSEPVDVVLRRPGAPDVKGTLHALCVGVSRYANPAFNLKFAAKDAEDVATVFARQKALYKDAKVTRLLDADATSPRVRAALAQIRKQAGPTDTVILFLSGHGIEDGSGRYYFGTHEVDPRALEKTALGAEALQTLLGGTLRAKAVFVFADTCHSGKIPARPASNGRLEALKTVVLTSSQAGEYSFERDEWGHGAFTLALLEALQGKADPDASVVEFDALVFYVRRRVQALLGKAQQVTVSANGIAAGAAVVER